MALKSIRVSADRKYVACGISMWSWAPVKMLADIFIISQRAYFDSMCFHIAAWPSHLDPIVARWYKDRELQGLCSTCLVLLLVYAFYCKSIAWLPACNLLAAWQTLILLILLGAFATYHPKQLTIDIPRNHAWSIIKCPKLTGSSPPSLEGRAA